MMSNPNTTVPCTAEDEATCAYHAALGAQLRALDGSDLYAYQEATNALQMALQRPEHQAEIGVFFELRRTAQQRTKTTAARFAASRKEVEDSRESEPVKAARLRLLKDQETSAQAYNAGLAVLERLRDEEYIPSMEFLERVQAIGACTYEAAQQTFFHLNDERKLDFDLVRGIAKMNV